MFRHELVPVDRLSGQPQSHALEVNRPDDKLVVVEFASDGVKIEVAAKPKHRRGHGALDDTLYARTFNNCTGLIRTLEHRDGDRASDNHDLDPDGDVHQAR